MKKLLLLIVALVGSIMMITPQLALAGSVNGNVDCTQAPDSAFCKEVGKTGNNPIFGPKGILTRGAGLLALVTGIISVFMMIYAGLRFVMSGGDAGKIASARNTIIYASIGLIIALSAQAIVIFILKKL